MTQVFEAKIFVLNKNDPTCESRKKKYYERQMEGKLDAVDSHEKRKKVKKKKRQSIDEKITKCLDPRKTKMVVEFNNRESASIKSFAVKKEMR